MTHGFGVMSKVFLNLYRLTFFKILFLFGCAGSSLLCRLFFSLAAASVDSFLVTVHGLLIAVAFFVAEHTL